MSEGLAGYLSGCGAGQPWQLSSWVTPCMAYCAKHIYRSYQSTPEKRGKMVKDGGPGALQVVSQQRTCGGGT